ncbi:MAG: DUF1080 domain-containing protein [Candidatus Sumerlaeota bacterium]|nr:DUF1080 domain-containing protein [Candidatus Sumerlaeota bacterium]
MKNRFTSLAVSTGALAAIFAVLTLTMLLAASAPAAEREYAKDGSGVYGYRDTPVLPWCGFRVHDCDRPAPKRANLGPVPPSTPPPAGAVVLFDGKDLSKWEKSDCKVVDGCIEAASSNLTSKESFSSCQIHLEYMGPADFKGVWSNQGNNGVFLMGLYEIQIFDSFNEKIYPDGMAGAIYGQTPPLVNACRAPGEWQSFDITFSPALFEGDKLTQPARVTIMHNGVVVQNNEEIRGETGHRIMPSYKKKISKGPLVFGGHGCPVRFRNVWVKPL